MCDAIDGSDLLVDDPLQVQIALRMDDKDDVGGAERQGGAHAPVDSGKLFGNVLRATALDVYVNEGGDL